jgi:hypothetical protein
VITAVCASRDLKCELIRGYVKGKSVPVFQGRWFTPAGYLGGTKAGRPNLEQFLPGGIDRILDAQHISAFSGEEHELSSLCEALYRLGTLSRYRSHTRIRGSSGFLGVRYAPTHV